MTVHLCNDSVDNLSWARLNYIHGLLFLDSICLYALDMNEQNQQYYGWANINGRNGPEAVDFQFQTADQLMRNRRQSWAIQ
jgi:hypothetical protein